MIVPTQQSELSQLLFKGSSQVADYVQALKKIKHHDLYLGVGLCNHAEKQASVIQRLAQLHDLPCVAIDEIRYLKAEDAFRDRKSVV